MRAHLLLLLLGSAAMLAGCAAQDPTNCDLGDPAGLSNCIKQLLIESRSKIAKEADPLRLPDHNKDGVQASNIRVLGISRYSVDDLDVSFPSGQKIAVSAKISWPRIKGYLNVKARKCKRIVFKLCATVRAEPEVKVGRTEGTLTTTLNINVAPDGKITVTASGTNVSLNLASISVKANLKRFIGAINRLFGDPASRIVTKKANKWWRDNKAKIEKKAKDALDKAVREKVAVHLSRLLRL